MKTIPLFWFSKEKLHNKPIRNFGDDINPLLIEKISGKNVQWKNPKTQSWVDKKFKKIYFAIGSIIHFATDNSVIWGSGLIDSSSPYPVKAEYLAVRGPNTYQILKKANCTVNNIFGDPALLLPKYFPQTTSKKFTLGIIPHYTEVDAFKKAQQSLSNEIIIIDLKDELQTVLEQIVSCEKIVSSSLHGIIVGMAYGIPSLRIQISDQIIGDGIKYQDYYQSVGIKQHTVFDCKAENVNIQELLNNFNKFENQSLIQKDLENIQDQLLSVQPF